MSKLINIAERAEHIRPEGLKKVYEDARELDEARKRPVKFSDPLITMGEIKLIFPRSTNLVQGSYGVHKSRIIEHLIATILKGEGEEPILDLEYCGEKDPFVIWIDTEREKDVFLYAVQTILTHSGYNIADDIRDRLFFSSFVEYNREERVKRLEELLHDLRLQHKNKHITVFIDTLTDLVIDFNRPRESNVLIDLINKLRSRYEITFISVMHENPPTSGASGKAKGHLGTLIVDKSTTVMSIGYEKNSKEILAIDFLKTRRSRIPDKILVKYNESKKQLVRAVGYEIKGLSHEKAPTNKVAKELLSLLENPSITEMKRSEAIEKLVKVFGCGVKTIRKRLKIIEDEKILENHGYELKVEERGKTKYYLCGKTNAGEEDSRQYSLLFPDSQN